MFNDGKYAVASRHAMPIYVVADYYLLDSVAYLIRAAEFALCDYGSHLVCMVKGRDSMCDIIA